ncbi:serine/threonine-protein kinase pim-2-like [Neoarius graeffei]|uniref:serine/threonine-protein kinase pim-2-like n=1 Tax=Neoarius graeffei TaxID=443677 RepID=UPI00298D2D4F|nr:serine/threonine-protein kinase pim-2-like [Neoarius graeffei]
MDLVHEGPEPQLKEKSIKRSRTETQEKTESRRESKENPLKRKDNTLPLKKRPVPQHDQTVEKRRASKTQNGGKFFNRYILGKLLGKGGFGSVYAGIRKADGEKVALKFINKYEEYPYTTLPGDTQRLPLEVALMELVSKPPHCPYVIKLLEWFETPKIVILVLERPEPCVDLFEYCEDVKISENKAQVIMQQIVNAARHCRDRGVIHRDIKDQNILINPQTLDVKLIDFGCGDLLKDTPYTEYSGSQDYEPPEWIIEKKYEAEPATVWGLGIFLYTLLHGAEPFNGPQEIVNGHLDFPSNLSEASCSLIEWCLQRNPKRRPTLEQILTHHWFWRHVNEKQQNKSI